MCTQLDHLVAATCLLRNFPSGMAHAWQQSLSSFAALCLRSPPYKIHKSEVQISSRQNDSRSAAKKVRTFSSDVEAAQTHPAVHIRGALVRLLGDVPAQESGSISAAH